MAKRNDAKEIKNLDPFHSVVPYVMPKRTESEISATETFDITDLLKYIDDKNSKENANLKLFHCICYSIARTIYHRSKMNIFISGRKYWQRNDISLSFVAKQKFEDNAEEVLMFLKINPEMTINEISKKILGDVKEVKQLKKNDLDGVMSFVGKLPRFLLTFIFFVVSRLEYHGIVPEALTKGDPNYSTCLLANLGSIGAGAPYHHLSNYGTCSMMATIGKYYIQDNRTILPITFILDERIADGFYFAKSLKYTKYILEHPELTEENISKPLNINE